MSVVLLVILPLFKVILCLAPIKMPKLFASWYFLNAYCCFLFNPSIFNLINFLYKNGVILVNLALNAT